MEEIENIRDLIGDCDNENRMKGKEYTIIFDGRYEVSYSGSRPDSDDESNTWRYFSFSRFDILGNRINHVRVAVDIYAYFFSKVTGYKQFFNRLTSLGKNLIRDVDVDKKLFGEVNKHRKKYKDFYDENGACVVAYLIEKSGKELILTEATLEKLGWAITSETQERFIRKESPFLFYSVCNFMYEKEPTCELAKGEYAFVSIINETHQYN